MKVTWEASDIIAGRIIMFASGGERWIIGYDATVATDADGPRWTLISLRDGMVQHRKHKADLATHLTTHFGKPIEIMDQ